MPLATPAAPNPPRSAPPSRRTRASCPKAPTIQPLPSPYTASFYRQGFRGVLLASVPLQALSIEDATLFARLYEKTVLRLEEPYSLYVSPKPGSESMEEFLKRMRPRFTRLLRAFRIPSEVSEDLVQQTLLRYVASASRIDTPDAWVFRTLRHHCCIYWRDRRPPQKNFGLFREAQSSDEDFIDGAYAAMEARLDVDAYLRLLPASASHLPFLQQLSSTEIAARTHYKPQSVRRLVSRALERLALRLNLQAPPDPEGA